MRARVAAADDDPLPRRARQDPPRVRPPRRRAAASARGALPTPPRLAAPLAPPPAPAPPAPRAGRATCSAARATGCVREIGRGASSVVYEAEHLDLGKRVAIKVLAAAGPARARRRRFRREARTLSRLSHEGLVAVHDVGQAADGGGSSA